MAVASAVPITFFFYMDQVGDRLRVRVRARARAHVLLLMEQNISSLLCQLPKHQLRHGHYYHSSFLWMGLFNAVAPRFQPQPQPEPPT